MKILDLLEGPIQTNIEPEKLFNGVLKSRPNGYSSFSSVSPVKNSPHEIKKYGHTPLAIQEGFNFFIKYIIETNNQSNIHFPRVYSVQKIGDKDGKHIDKYIMERLIDLDSVSYDELVIVFKQNFKIYNQNYVSAAEVADIISRCVNSTPSREEEILSDSLSEALKLTNDCIKKCKEVCSGKQYKNYRVCEDLHSGNIMLRRTQHGYQIVINDPIAILQFNP